MNKVLREIKNGTLPVDLLAERLETLVGKKSKKQTVSIFEDLSKRLNALVPTLSDGVEHSFVSLLDNVTDAVIEGQFEEKDKPFVGETVSLLEAVSRDFAAYAAEIRKGIAGQ